MYHSIIFGDKNTWADWYLIPSSRPVINPPSPKTKFVDIPGADGSLDMTTALTGDIPYSERTGSIEFIVDNGQLSDYNHVNWSRHYSEIMDYIHGKLMKATLEDDPSYYYEGRFSVNAWKSDPKNSKITIDYTVQPYKLEKWSSLEDWEWDLFNFEDSIIREYKDLKVDGELTLVVIGRRMAVTPSFKVKSTDGNGLKVAFNGTTYDLPDGTVKVPAAWMIEQCGWKGKRSGGAAVYDKQPLVIVNYTGEAYPEEIIGLERRIIASVKAKFGVDLHPEVDHI